MNQRANVLDLADVVSLEDAAARLGCTLDHLEMMAHARTLTVLQQERPAPWSGIRFVIERGELERVAALLDKGDENERESPGHVATLEWLLGALLHAYTGEDGGLLAHPYNLRDWIANDLLQTLEIAATGNDKQRKLYRTRESDANAIASALHRFQHSGLYRTPEQRRRDAEVTEAKEQRAEKPKPEEPEKKAA